MTQPVPDHGSIISVVGAGTWGVTLASLLGWKGYQVRVWDINEELIQQLDSTRKHPKLPNLEIPEKLIFDSNLDEVLRDAESIVIVTPSVAFRSAMQKVYESKTRAQFPIYILCSKGIEIETTMTMTDVAVDILGAKKITAVGVLSGPSHAEEVSRKIPTSVVASSEDPAVAQYVQKLFSTPVFRPYTQTDIKGVELGGALKNVIAIATGVCDGLGFGDNTRAALITRGLAEMSRLTIVMGGKASTLSGLAGLGDLIVTATSKHSRNRLFGELLTQTSSVEEVLEKVGMVVEGMPTSKAAVKLAEQYQIEMPISQEVVNLIYHGKSPKDAVQDLLSRETKPEIY